MNKDIKYAGFWVRFVASFLDTIFLALPVGIVVYYLSDGNWFDFSLYQQQIAYAMAGNAEKALTSSPNTAMKWELIFEVAVLVITMLFWKRWRGATPGKRLVHIKIVDAKTLKDINNTQAVTRSFGYIVSILTFCVGFLMIGLRQDKRGLHDLLADTSVIFDDIQS